MNEYILLFRGINVGGRNILPMKALTELLLSCGYEQVKTYIQSGNVVLKNLLKPTDEISQKINSQFGFKPNLMVLDAIELMAAVKYNPFQADEGKTIHFFFLADQPVVNTEKLQLLATETERHHLTGQVFYLYAPDGIGRSKLAAKVESCMGVAATGRNLNTVSKLVGMLEPDQ